MEERLDWFMEHVFLLPFNLGRGRAWPLKILAVISLVPWGLLCLMPMLLLMVAFIGTFFWEELS